MTQPVSHPEVDEAASETDAERKRRLAWEDERIAEAEADFEAGRYVDSAVVKAWIDSIGTDHELPAPYAEADRAAACRDD